MKNYLKYFNLLCLIVFAMVLVTSCEKDNEDDVIEETGLKLQIVNNSEFGYILVNEDNQSIYFFAGDVTGESNCNGGCADTWPAVTGDPYDIELGGTLNRSDFASIYRADGTQQLTYKGWPLYYFSPEADGVLENPGETEGDGRGGLFHIAKPDYTILLGRQSVEDGQDAVVYLTDDRGVTLYRNTGDEENISNCNGGCAGVWPPFKAAPLVLPSSLNAYDFDSLNREDDLGPQRSFKGSPLYFFSQDEEKMGSVLGQAGGPNQTFFVVAPEQ